MQQKINEHIYIAAPIQFINSSKVRTRHIFSTNKAAGSPSAEGRHSAPQKSLHGTNS